MVEIAANLWKEEKYELPRKAGRNNGPTFHGWRLYETDGIRKCTFYVFFLCVYVKNNIVWENGKYFSTSIWSMSLNSRAFHPNCDSFYLCFESNFGRDTYSESDWNCLNITKSIYLRHGICHHLTKYSDWEHTLRQKINTFAHSTILIM